MLSPAETRPELKFEPPRLGFNGDIPPIRPGPSTLRRPAEPGFFFIVADLEPFEILGALSSRAVPGALL